MAEIFEKTNDYTLRVIEDFAINSTHGKSLTRIFNFASAQVTTIFEEWINHPPNYKSGSAASLTSNTVIQNFSDVQSSLEIQLMHKKLVDMGGHPPELSEIVPLPPRKQVIGRQQ